MAINPKIARILDAEWLSFKAHLSPATAGPLSGPPSISTWWSNRLTPGFPSAWPCPPDGELIYYAWAAGIEPWVLMDGERTTLPWARFALSLSDGEVNYQRLHESPQMGSVQGMWPLSPAEAVISNAAGGVFDEFPGALSEQGSLPDETWMNRVKASYCFWVKCNGVTARQIRSFHQDFFVFLESKP